MMVRVLVAAVLIALVGCRKSDESLAKRAGNKVGETVTEFASGVGKGVDTNRHLVAVIVMTSALEAPSSAVAQTQGASAAEWRMSATDHFDITYTAAEAEQVAQVGLRAERAYEQLAAALRHDLSLRPLLVLFPTRSALDRAVASRTVPGNREHILVSLDVPPARRDGDFTHELSHVFAFDIAPSLGRGDAPRWILEGLAELERGDWDPGDRAVLEELLRTRTRPRLDRLRDDTLAGQPRLSHIVGHAAFEFLVARVGRDGLKRFLLSLQTGSPTDPAQAYLAAVGLSMDDFERGFDDYLAARFTTAAPG